MRSGSSSSESARRPPHSSAIRDSRKLLMLPSLAWVRAAVVSCAASQWSKCARTASSPSVSR